MKEMVQHQKYAVFSLGIEFFHQTSSFRVVGAAQGVDPESFGFLVLETLRTGAMRVIHIPVKTEETRRDCALSLYCTVPSVHST